MGASSSTLSSRGTFPPSTAAVRLQGSYQLPWRCAVAVVGHTWETNRARCCSVCRGLRVALCSRCGQYSAAAELTRAWWAGNHRREEREPNEEPPEPPPPPTCTGCERGPLEAPPLRAWLARERACGRVGERVWVLVAEAGFGWRTCERHAWCES
jgi:hypothetical protein